MTTRFRIVRDNIRLLGIFLMGFALLGIGVAGLKWSPGGTQMALLTTFGFECMGTAIIFLAWRDLDKAALSPILAAIAEVFRIQLTHAHEPEADALLRGTLTIPQAISLSSKMVLRSKDSAVPARERRIAVVVAETIDLWVEIEQDPAGKYLPNP